MNAIEFERRLRKLAVRDGMTFSTLITLDDGDRAVLRTTMLARFDPAAVYTERQVNERLKAWLTGVGSMIETDHVNLRRLLVDTLVLTRTSDCAEYRVHPGAMAGLPAGLVELDADGIVAHARHTAGLGAVVCGHALGPGNGAGAIGGRVRYGVAGVDGPQL